MAMAMHHLLLFLLLVPLLTYADPLYDFCGTTGNYTANSTYASNLAFLNRTLPTNTTSSPTHLFANATVGAVPNQVIALALCRGDDNATACSSCVATAFQDAQNLCRYNRDVTIYYDYCLLRYSNQHFLSSTDNSQMIILMSTANITTNPSEFNKIVAQLMNATGDYAAVNATNGFGTGTVPFDTQWPTIYSLAQCTPDLTAAQCQSCLQQIIQMMPQYFDGRQGGRILGVRCNYRYEVYPFYTSQPLLQLPPTTPAASPVLPPALQPNGTSTTPQGGGSGKSNVTTVVLAIVLPVAAAILAIALVFYCFLKGKRSRKASVPYAADPEDIDSVESLLLDLATVRTATADFAESNKLGEGGFGAVYKGVLPSGEEIAVKRLSQSSGQGIDEMKNELVLVAKLQHKNLVRLVGVCLEEQEKLLVYEYVPNRSLDTILFDAEKSKTLDWGARFKIINGVARGLQYLHEDSQLKIIHRDLKPSNILLDADMNPKISDFGFARLFGGDQTQDITKSVVGTFGYMAPEYAMHGQFSVKSDVFSFGVIILEIVTGRKNSGSYNSEEFEDLLSLVWEHWNKGTISDIMDPNLSNSCPSSELSKYIHVGLLCVQENPADRPMMSSVVVMVSSDTVSLQAPLQPAFCFSKTGVNLNSSSNLYPGMRYQSTSSAIPMSPNEVSITELEPR